jgi:hypothetical protein
MVVVAAAAAAVADDWVVAVVAEQDSLCVRQQATLQYGARHLGHLYLLAPLQMMQTGDEFFCTLSLLLLFPRRPCFRAVNEALSFRLLLVLGGDFCCAISRYSILMYPLVSLFLKPYEINGSGNLQLIYEAGPNIFKYSPT